MNDLTPKELYEQKKRGKISTEISKERTKIAKKLLIWLIAVLFVGGGISWLVKRSQEKIASRKIYATHFPELSREHISVGSPRPAYNSNPPTSGPHYANPAEKGVYKKELADEQLVHNLEHGYIWISYRPDVSLEIVKQLENFYSFGKKIIVDPRKENDKLIAFAAWGWLDKFNSQFKDALNNEELKRIQDFIDTYINQGPEPYAP